MPFKMPRKAVFSHAERVGKRRRGRKTA